MEDFLKKDKVRDLLLSLKLLRNQTNKLVEKLEIDDQVIQTANYVSPIKWHLSHISLFFEKFVLSKYCKNYKLFSKDYDFRFNSYYENISRFNLREKRNEKLSGIFAAKEAVSKALGFEFRNGITYKNIEIINNEFNKPEINLVGEFKKLFCRLKKKKFSSFYFS
tara:strand:+ start:174 stop:668 length:495 start_codon:yes stop_codon:yes gene_type:complete